MKTNLDKLKFIAEFSSIEKLEEQLPLKQLEMREKFIQFIGLELGPRLKQGEEIPIVKGSKQAAKVMYMPMFLGDTLIATVTPQTHFIVHMPLLHQENIPIEHLKELQKDVRAFLERFVDWDKNRETEPHQKFSRQIQAWFTVTPHIVSNRLIEEISFVSGDQKKDLKDGIFLVLSDLVRNTKVWIRKCPAVLGARTEKTCGTIFFSRDVRKIYCTNVCSTRVRVIRDRRGDSPEEKAQKNKARLIEQVKKLKSEQGGEKQKPLKSK